MPECLPRPVHQHQGVELQTDKGPRREVDGADVRTVAVALVLAMRTRLPTLIFSPPASLHLSYFDPPLPRPAP